MGKRSSFLCFYILQRAKKWAEGMDHMGNDRLRFANILMETLEDIEQQSGIFLIKPMYSFKGRLVLSYIFLTCSHSMLLYCLYLCYYLYLDAKQNSFNFTLH